jgi:hypothetical protein
VAGDELGLRSLILVRHLGRVAARTLAFDSLHLVDEDRLGAEALDLFLDRRAHVGRGDDRAQPPRGRDRLEAGDADAHDEHARGRDRAGGRHHHRKGAAIFGGGVEHRLVAAEIGLGGQDVHRLRARDARDELERERLNAAGGISVDTGTHAERVQCRDQQRTRRDPFEGVRIGALHREHGFGAAQHLLARTDQCAGRDIIGICYGSALAGAGLDRQARAQRRELLDRLGGDGDAPLAFGLFLQDRDLHPPAAFLVRDQEDDDRGYDEAQDRPPLHHRRKAIVAAQMRLEIRLRRVIGCHIRPLNLG